MAILSLVLGIAGIPTLGLFLIGALAGLGLGVAALIKARKTPAEYGGKGIAIAGIVANCLALVAIPFVGIFAAIAIPSFLRARVSANESVTIGDLRAVVAAEAVYQGANGGLFDTLECLGAPGRCIPGYTGPSFLDPGLAVPSKSGYQRTFHPGPAAAEGREGVSPSSLESYAFVAVPLTPRTTGMRAFCADSSGRICATSDGSAPQIEDGSSRGADAWTGPGHVALRAVVFAALLTATLLWGGLLATTAACLTFTILRSLPVGAGLFGWTLLAIGLAATGLLAGGGVAGLWFATQPARRQGRLTPPFRHALADLCEPTPSRVNQG